MIKRILYKNDIVFYFLDEIKQCLPDHYIDMYAQQLDYINKIVWVLNKEVDLFFSKNYPTSLNIDEFQETKIAELNIIDENEKKYKIRVYFVNGRIFSIESNLPFKGLLVDELKQFSIKCLLS